MSLAASASRRARPALLPSSILDSLGHVARLPDRTVDSLCPYCGVGCQLTYQIANDRILSVVGRDGPANHNRLCVKGRFGYDYVTHPQRLTRPLIRKADAPKGRTSSSIPLIRPRISEKQAGRKPSTAPRRLASGPRRVWRARIGGIRLGEGVE